MGAKHALVARFRLVEAGVRFVTLTLSKRTDPVGRAHEYGTTPRSDSAAV